MAKQVKTKVIIKKEPVPRQWSPSQLRLKRYPPDASKTVARELFPINTMMVPRELSPTTRLEKAVSDAKITFFSLFEILTKTFVKN